jgi:hypothetical protein
MRTPKILLSAILMVALLFTTNGIAQEKEKESYAMAEITYMLPKIGSEQDFVKGVAAHNDKYHAEAPHTAYLDNILTGKDAGWYVWIMAPCTFSDLDSKPGLGAHSDHWNKNVAPTIQKYGRTEYWRVNMDLSYYANETEAKLETLWVLDLKRGDYYRFKNLMTKIKAAYEKKGTDNIGVYDNQFYANDGREVVIVWDSQSWSEFDDNNSIKKEYEEVHGEGSWQSMLDEWNDIVVSINSQVWRHNVR